MVLVDDSHQGPLVNVAAWILIIVAVVLGIGKILTKWRITSELHADDGFMAISITLAIGATVAAGYQVSFGLGSHADTLSADQIDNFQKALMATDVLYIATIFTAKLSLIRFLRNFTPPNRKRTFVDVFIYVLGLWMLIAVVCTVCRCQGPDTWDLTAAQRCINFNAFWTVNSLVDIVSQIMVATAPIYLLWDVQIRQEKKRLAVIAYLPVVTTAPFEIIRLVSVWQLDPAAVAADVTFAFFHVTLYTVMHSAYSIVASCSTFLIPVVEALSVGLISSKVALIPRRDNPHVRRDAAAAPFNPLVVLGGQNFLVTNVTAGTPSWTSPTATANKHDSSRWPGSKRASALSNAGAMGGLGGGVGVGIGGSGSDSRRVSKAPTDHYDVELEQIERFGSRDAMVINTTTTFEWRSNRNSVSTSATPATLIEEATTDDDDELAKIDEPDEPVPPVPAHFAARGLDHGEQEEKA